MSIRNAVLSDFNFIRKLPVQLAYPATVTLTAREIQSMLDDPNMRLLVFETAKKPSAFMALNLMPAINHPGTL